MYRDKQCLSSKRLKLCRCNGKQSHSTSTSCFVVFALKGSSSHSDNVAASLLPKCLEFIFEQGPRPRLSATKELYSSAVQLSCCAFSFDDVHLNNIVILHQIVSLESEQSYERVVRQVETQEVREEW